MGNSTSRANDAAHIPWTRWWTAYAFQLYGGWTLKSKPEYYCHSRTVAEPFSIKIPTRHGVIDGKVYKPAMTAPCAVTRSSEALKPPLHVQIHGGGFIITSNDMDDHVNKYFASEVGCFVVSFQYDAAPQKQHPVTEEQCYDAVKWLANSDAYGWDSTRITVGGASAGGKLAVNVAQQLHWSNSDLTLRGVILDYAVMDIASPERSTPSNPKPMIDKRLISLIHDTFIPQPSARTKPLASPLFDGNIAASMPATLILYGGRDSLSLEMIKFAQILREGGVEVESHCFPDSDHGYTNMGPAHIIRASLGIQQEFLTKLLLHP